MAVNQLLLHSKCLRCGFEDRDVLCMISVLGQSEGSPWVILLQLPQHYLRGEIRRNLDPYFHQLTTLRVVICTYEELVGSKAIQ